MRRQLVISCFTLFVLLSCSFPEKQGYIIELKNNSAIERVSETIEVSTKELAQFSVSELQKLKVFDDKGKNIPFQFIDIDQDSIYDYLIFQTHFDPNENKIFKLESHENEMDVTETSISTFCRIVPERMDDFAWENDKVAFRSYGPRCQELYEEGDPTGLISSGIDCWTKRVDYPIINKWYKEDRNGKSYHEDHGEGLDAYHVGTTRGCGGTALFNNGQIVLSKNFTNWKVITNGPIRSIFELTYAPVEIDGNLVTEKKRITLDLGSNLYYAEIFYSAERPVDLAAIGIALHQGKGEINSDRSSGWITYWEPMGDSDLGVAILTDAKKITDVKLDDTLHEDESMNNLWIQSKVEKQKLTYWAGFGWKRSGDFNSAEDWNDYIKIESIKKGDPIQLTLTEN